MGMYPVPFTACPMLLPIRKTGKGLSTTRISVGTILFPMYHKNESSLSIYKNGFLKGIFRKSFSVYFSCIFMISVLRISILNMCLQLEDTKKRM